MEKISFRIATKQDLEKRWDYLIAENAGDKRWQIWQEQTIKDNNKGTKKSFIALLDNEIVGEVTLVMSNFELNGLRVNKEYEGRGIASGLVKFVEAWATKHGLEYLMIGVEPREVRNMQIFFHWGYTEFLNYSIDKYPPKDENDSGEEVFALYYRKKLS